MLDGTIPCCRTTRASVAYYSMPHASFRFSLDHAEEICAWMEKYVSHNEGEWAGEPFILEPWQCWVYAMVEGWRSGDIRRFRTAYVEIPRKNGKTLMASGMGLRLMAADGEKGSHVYSAASQEKQAKISVIGAWHMAGRDPLMSDYRVARHGSPRINPSLELMTEESGPPRTGFYEGTGDTFGAVAQDRSGSLDGLNVSGAIIDELHAHTEPNTPNTCLLYTSPSPRDS